MAHDVFVSCSSKDKDVARVLVSAFDAGGVRCWLAERDVAASADFTTVLTEAIDSSRLVVLLLSHNASSSVWVRRELVRALEKNLPILPVRIDESSLDDGLRFMLSLNQRFDAFEGRIEGYLAGLVKIAQELLGIEAKRHLAMPTASSEAELAGLRLDAETVRQVRGIENRVPFGGVISRARPACLLFIVDQSFSMNAGVAGTSLRKKVAVADAVNRLIYNMVLASTKDDGVRPYFHVGVFRYGVEEGVDAAFTPDVVSISELADHPLRWSTPPQCSDDDDLEVSFPIWFEPYARGKTLTRDAFLRVLAVTKSWTEAHPDSFPPIILHITDGGFDRRRDDPTLVVRELQDQNTSVGGALVFNCHLSSRSDDEPLFFPNPHEAEQLDAAGSSLFEISSPLPEVMRESATTFYDVHEGARGYVRNADLDRLVDFLDIGTRTVSSAARRA